MRYFATFQPGTARSAEETLRVVAALREVDLAQGGIYLPADLRTGEPVIPSTKAGVSRFYKRRSGEEKEEGWLSALRVKLSQFYEMLFGNGTLLRRKDQRKVEEVVDSIVEEAEQGEEQGEKQGDRKK